MTKINVFVSYSHKDIKWKERFEEILKPVFGDEAELCWWDDREIEVSDEWDEKIQSALHQADIFVCLVSPAFLASDYISHHELPEIVRRREKGLAHIACLYLKTSKVNHENCSIKMRLDDGSTARKNLTKYQGLNSHEHPIAAIDGEEKQNIALNQAADKLLDLIGKFEPKNLSQRDEPTDRFELSIRIKQIDNEIRLTYFDSTQLILERRDESKLFHIALEQWRKSGETSIADTKFTDSLFSVLFGQGDDDCSTRVLKIVAAASDADRPTKFALRLRIYCENHPIASLPWSATTYRGEPLLDCHWIFEHHAQPPIPGPKGESSISCIHPLPAMVLNPAAGSDDDTPGRGMMQVLEASLKQVDRPPPKRYRSWRQLQKETGRAIPELVYFVGSVSMNGDKVNLYFKDGDRDERVPIAELLTINPRLPKVLYLNIITDTPFDTLQMARQLGRDIPVILVQQGGSAELSALEHIAANWISSWMDQGGNPVAVFNRVTKDQGQAYTAYENFESKKWVEPGRVKKDLAILLLDRHTQRAAISTELRNVVNGGDHRLLFAPICAEPGNYIERFPEQLLRTLETHEGVLDMAQVERVEMEWPRDHDELSVPLLENSIKKRLAGDPDRDLGKILAERRPSAPPGRGSVLLLHWPVLSHCPTENDLAVFENLLTRHLAPKCPSDLRILVLLMVEIDASEHDTLEKYGERLTIGYSAPEFVIAEVDPLDKVTRRDLVKYLNREEDTRCPRELSGPISELIIDRTRGHFSETTALLEKGMYGWYDLRDELRH